MNKASRGDRIPAELFKILKDNAVQVLHSTCQKIWKTAVAQDWKRSSSIPIPRKVNKKEWSNYCKIALHMLAMPCLKSFKRGFRRTWTENFQMYKLGFKEAEKSEITLLIFVKSWRNQESSRKISTSASLTMLKPLTLGIINNCGIINNIINT